MEGLPEGRSSNAPRSLKERLQGALRERDKTVAELANERGADAGQIRTRLNEVRDTGTVKRGEDRWGLLKGEQ